MNTPETTLTECPIHGCHRWRTADRFLCPHHWDLLPAHYRERIEANPDPLSQLRRKAEADAKSLIHMRRAIGRLEEAIILIRPIADMLPLARIGTRLMASDEAKRLATDLKTFQQLLADEVDSSESPDRNPRQ